MDGAKFLKQSLSYDVASESVITLCIKNDNPLVDKICKLFGYAA